MVDIVIKIEFDLQCGSDQLSRKLLIFSASALHSSYHHRSFNVCSIASMVVLVDAPDDATGFD